MASERQSPPARAPLLVELAVAGPHARAIRRFVDAGAGWQQADGTALRASVRLADVAGLGRHGDPGSKIPTVLLVGEQAGAVAAARTAARGVEAVVAWPGGREDLAAVAADLRSEESRAAAELTVGGAAGGVGTTTVALALAGLVAWHRVEVLAITHGVVPAPTGSAVEPDALAGPGAWRAGAPAPGLRRLRVLETTSPAPVGPVDAGPAGLVVRDLGVGRDADVLVVRRDAAGLAGLEATTAGTVVCTEVGPARPQQLRAAARGRRLVGVAWSARVARAGLAGRVPAGLPGAWLAPLAPIVAALASDEGLSTARVPAASRAGDAPA